MSQASTALKKLVGIGTIVLGIPFLAACSWCLMVKDWHQATLMEGLSFGILILLLAMPGLLYRPNRAAGFGAAAVILLLITLFGFVVFTGVISFIFDIFTRPRVA